MIETIVGIAQEVRSPFPDDFLRELDKGGYAVALGPSYSAMEAYFIHRIGHFMEAMAAGDLVPFHPSQSHFVKAVRGEVRAENEVETAWIKFVHDYPDRSGLPHLCDVADAAQSCD